MRIIFMGTPDFSVPSLDALLNSNNEVLVVVTQPDRPKGRHLHLQSSPVKKFAQEKNLSILQPSNLNEQDFKRKLSGFDAEAVAVVAYGRIIPSWILSLPRHGCINVHASLLPKYRGAAPIQRAIMDGCEKTGITTMLLDEGIDTGSILLQSEVRIEQDEPTGDLAAKLAQVGAQLLLETLDRLADQRISPTKQDEDQASYAPKIEKEEALIDWSKPAVQIRDLVRALGPAPGAYTYLRGDRLKIWKAEVAEETTSSGFAVGTFVHVGDDRAVVATGAELLAVTVLQPENKRKMTVTEFLSGHKIDVGERLG